jgi:prevent-host-death family protein
MSRMVNIHEAKTHLSRLLQEVADGEEIIIGKAGKPVAVLSAYVGDRRSPGSWKGRVWLAPDFDQLPPEVEEAFAAGDE